MGYFDYDKQHDYLICIDSDGCAMDTMNIKHERCFGPEWITTYGLEEIQEEALQLWLDINLFSATRGINRFKALAMALQEVAEMGYPAEGLEEFVRWTHEAPELSNPALLAECQRNDCPCMELALLWSIRTNRSIRKLPQALPYPHVKETMDELCKNADLTAVSSANGQAVEEEWSFHHLKEDTRVLLSQEAGSKAFCIGQLLKKDYDPKKTLMVGDAPGDYAAAQKNGVRFYPILANKEVESWQRLLDEAAPKLFHGTFDDEYQAQLVKAFEENLGIG